MTKTVYAGIFTLLAVAACKNTDLDINTDVTSSTEFVTAEMSFNDVGAVVNNIGIDEEGVGKLSQGDSCTTVTVSTTPGTFPRVMTIDYGTGCVGMDGRNRAGQLIVTFTNAWLADTCQVSVQMVNYTIDGVLTEGEVIMQKTKSSVGKIEIVSNVNGGKIHLPDGIVEYESIKTTEWLQGGLTASVEDDIIKVYGNSNGVTSDGVQYSSVIVQPLYREFSCDYISEGIIDFTPSGELTRSTNFGDMTCDNIATVTIGSVSVEITLD